MRLVLCYTFAVVCLATSTVAQQDKFTDRLLKNRYELGVQQGTLLGNGAAVLKNAINDAQFVLIGEDHGIAQIPQFVGAVCDVLGPLGFHSMAMETGPLVGSELETWAQGPDGRNFVAEFVKKFPETIAFYDYEQEFAMLQQCARAARPAKFHLWGLDQELMGSSGFIFQQILGTHPGKEAEAAVKDLVRATTEARTNAAETGNPAQLFMMTADEAGLKKTAELLRKEGNARAQELFAQFMASRDIYQKFMAGQGYESNRERARLMKSNFVSDYSAATHAEGKPPKVLFKFGGNHMYKGFNQLHSNEIGNYALELAEGQGKQSVHILILAVSGEQLAFSGVGRPYHAEKVDAEDKNSDIGRLKPIFEKMNPQGWTMFDLRGLRQGFGGLDEKSADVGRIVFAYDFLILIPQAKASTQIQ